MRLPPQVPPVKRPHRVSPHQAVDVTHGRVEDLVRVRIELMHGANFNDPQAFRCPAWCQMARDHGCNCEGCWF